MKKYLALFLLFVVPVSLWPQKSVISNQYIYELFLMNPAAAGINKDCFYLKAFHWQQWIGMDLAPTTQIFTMSGRLSGNLGTGTYLYNDRNGFQKEIGLQQAFSYEVFLVKKRKKRSSITFGLAGSVNQHRIDQSEFDTGVFPDPTITGVEENGWGYNLATGFLFKYNRFNCGMAVSNMLEQNNPVYSSTNEPDMPMSIKMHAGTTIRHNKDKLLFYEPSIMYQKDADLNNRLDINAKASMPSPTNNSLWLWGQLSYRRTMDKTTGKDLATAVSMGVIYKKMNVGIEYQIGLTSARQYLGNAYQLIVGYNFCKRPYGGIPCSEKELKSGHKYKTVKR